MVWSRDLAMLLLIWQAAFAQGVKFQRPGDFQKPGTIQQPTGKWQVPGKIQKPGEIQKFKEQCKSRWVVGSDALFQFDQAELTPNAESVLSALGAMVRKESAHPVTIEGHTDGMGASGYNQELSEKRAHTVEAWLVTHGYLRMNEAQTRGFGKTKPIAPNTKPDGSDDPEGRQKNRRVEVVVDTCKS